MIVLIRHAEAENAGGRAIGQTELPLSGTGEIQANLLGKAMRDLEFKTFLSSPLSRTMRTAEAIAENCSVSPTACAELAEINLGEWDGLSFENIKKKFPSAYLQRGQDIAGFRPPGGESFLDLKKRVDSVLNRLDNQDSPALLVTHAGVIRVVMHMVLGFPLANIFCIKPSHCYCTIISKKKDSYTLNGYNLPPGTELSSVLKSLMQQQP